MATKELHLSIETRDGSGTTSSNALRKSGKVPGVLYGHGSTPVHVVFDAKAFEELLHSGARNSLITLSQGGKKGETALVREIQRDPLSRKVIHADLQLVSANEEVHARLPVHTVGVAAGVRDMGGVLDIISHELEIAGPANRLPDHIEVDVSHLGIHEHISAGEIKLPEGFKMITPADTNVVGVESSKTATQLEEAATPAEQVQPEVIGEKPAEGQA